MIGNAVYAILTASQAIMGLTDGRITANIIPQDQATPCIYYGTDNVNPIPVRGNDECFSGLLEVGFQTATYTELDALTTAVREALDNYAGIADGTALRIDRAISTPDDFDDELKLHTRALSFRVSGQLTTSNT